MDGCNENVIEFMTNDTRATLSFSQGRYKSAGAGCLPQTGFSWIDGKTLPGDPSGCDEPVILFLKCIYGNHDYIWFLCEK